MGATGDSIPLKYREGKPGKTLPGRCLQAGQGVENGAGSPGAYPLDQAQPGGDERGSHKRRGPGGRVPSVGVGHDGMTAQEINRRTGSHRVSGSPKF